MNKLHKSHIIKTESILYAARSLKHIFFHAISSVQVISGSCYLQSRIRIGYFCKWSEVIEKKRHSGADNKAAYIKISGFIVNVVNVCGL